ncbi:anaphase promoting complex subunit 5 [Saccharomyces paradoxus]|uniref:Anaphase-promoting complex subunit 5 n=1 Tax=Saccharomyces paradoxus TaxID=27291 RepID=A0A8B8V033_SACPA|nr:Apc5 [Saccharomyces paradoxus]QHS76337.1 Apc5 [Saccharomyces paradoxus]
MSEYGPLGITNFITPYDLCILVLIHVHSSQDNGIAVPTEVFLRLISPTRPSIEWNPLLKDNSNLRPSSVVPPPILPILENVIRMLLDDRDGNKIALTLMGYLEAINGLDSINRLMMDLEKNCLVNNYRSMKVRTTSTRRQMTRASFLGTFLSTCIRKYQFGDFEMRETIWINLQNFKTAFKQTPLWQQFKDNIHIQKVKNCLLANDEISVEDQQMVEFFQNFDDCNDGNSKTMNEEINGTLISIQHLQSIVNRQIVDWLNTTEFNSNGRKEGDITSYEEQRQLVFDMLDTLSLNDATKFPLIFILKYLEAIKENSYQIALDSLHNYFDYKSTGNSQNYFHISLLSLATFHSSFNECDAAINSFEEATRIARENKDMETLNLIMIWIINFIEVHPEYANRFYITVEQIIKYLKNSSDVEDANIFSSAYKFETLLSMVKESKTADVSSSLLKFMAITLQNVPSQNFDLFQSLVDYEMKFWKEQGYESISGVYEKFISQTSSSSLRNHDSSVINRDIKAAFKALEEDDFSKVKQYLLKSESLKLDYAQQINFKYLRVKYLIRTGDYDLSMRLINQYIKECCEEVADSNWRFKFEIESINVLLLCNVGIRGLPKIMQLIDKYKEIGNPLRCVILLLKLCEVLVQVGKGAEAECLVSCNLSTILEFPFIRKKTNELLKSISVEKDTDVQMT